MNSRQKDILSAVIRLYTETAQPVGSATLLERKLFSVSPATIRNDMLALEKEGYLYQPHTSAGRIPTDQGYRFFVEEMMRDQPLTKKEQEKLQREFLMLQAKYARMTRTTARLLSVLSGNLAVAGIIGKDEIYDFGMKALIEEPEFQKMDELCRLVETLDTLDERLDVLMKSLRDGQTKIFIGKENPLSKEINNCSMVVSPWKNKEGDHGILAIIGPKRMEYAKNKSLIEYMKKLLSSSSLAIIFIAYV